LTPGRGAAAAYPGSCRRGRKAATGPRAKEPSSDIVRKIVNDPFKAIAHPIRRGIVEQLARGPATVGEATSGLGLSKPAITRHVKVLEEAGVVVRTVEGRTHRLGLDLDALSEPVEWIDQQRALWERMLDAVEEYLEEQNQTK
jgi:DNA-binding transcriptional ArsR family regulator